MSRADAWALVVLAIAVVSGAVLRLHALGTPPLDFDEAISFYIAQGTLDQVLAKNLVHNSSPPFMAVALQQMLRFGESEFVVRLLPALAGVAIIPVMFLICRRASGPLAGAAASLMIALSSPHVELSREYRIYEIGAFLAAISTLVLMEYFNRPSRLWAILSGCVLFAAIQVQYGLAVYCVSALLAVAAALAGSRMRWRERALQFGVMFVGVVLSALVVYQVSLRAQYYPGRGSTYISAFSGGVAGHIRRLISVTLDMAEYAFQSHFSLFMVGLCLVAAVRGRRADPVLLIAGASTAALAVLAVLGWYPYGPARQCLFLTIPIIIIAASGFENLVNCWPASLRKAYGGCLALAILWPVAAQKFEAHRRIDRPAGVAEALRIVDSEYRAGDVLFVTPGAFPEFHYYGREFRRPWRKAQESEAWMSDERAWREMAPAPPYPNQIKALTHEYSRVWILATHHHPIEPSFAELSRRLEWMKLNTRLDAPFVTLSLHERPQQAAELLTRPTRASQ